jgi:hypothetical protein
VEQPVQSWDVFRSHEDFLRLGEALMLVLPGLPSCPYLADVQGNLDVAVQARNELQDWLTTSILMYPGAREAPALRAFLTVGVNSMPPQYEGVVWTQFNPMLSPSSNTGGCGGDAAGSTSPVTSSPSTTGYATTMSGGGASLDDMDMAEMFFAADDETGGATDVFVEDEDYIPSASERYKPADPKVTEEDTMDMMGEVEMIDDIGMLAQSLGASHLGRSLQLQAEMMIPGPIAQSNRPVQGLNVGGPAPQQQLPRGQSSGGLGSAIANAANGPNYGYNQVAPTSAPRLDSFRMIRVIGKGSFGTFCKSTSRDCTLVNAVYYGTILYIRLFAPPPYR